MENKAVCPECGASELRVQTYIRVSAEYDADQGEITKDIINKESTRLYDDDPPVVAIFCEECGHILSREVYLSYRFKNDDLLNAINERMEVLEKFRKNTLEDDFQLELASNDIDNPNRMADLTEFKRRVRIKAAQKAREQAED